MGDTAKKAIPIAAGVLGGIYGGPAGAEAGFSLMGAAAGASLGSVASGLLSPDKSAAAPAPVVAAPKTMPTPDDETVKRARRRSLLQQYQRSGRSSTILSREGDTLG